jgi:hypothetical protein
MAKKTIQQQLEQYEEWGTKEIKKKNFKTTINNKSKNCKYYEAQGH